MSESLLPEANWRPTTTATTAAASIAVVSTLALAAIVGDALVPAALGVLSGAALAATVRTVAAAERRVAAAVGGSLAVVAGAAFLGWLLAAVVVQTAWPPIPPIEVLALAPFLFGLGGFVTGFGAFSSVRSRSPTADAGRTAARLLLVVVVPVCAIGGTRIDAPLTPVRNAALEFLAAPTPTLVSASAVFSRLGGLLILFSASAVAVRYGVAQLPFVELASESARPTAIAVRRWSRRFLGYAAAFSGLIGFMFILTRGRLAGYEHELPPELMGTLAAASASPTLRGGLIAAGVAAIVAVLLIRTLRFVASERFPPRWLPVVSFTTGGVLTAGAAVANEPAASVALSRATTPTGETVIRELLTTFGSFSLLTGLIVASIGVASTLAISISLAAGVRALGAAAGMQLAGTGVFIAAIAAGIAGGPVLVVLCGVAASLLVWDLGEFAVTLGLEIGHRGPTRRGELTHVVGGVVIVSLAVAVGVAVVLATGRLPEPSSEATTLAVIAATLGTVTLLVVAR